MIQFINNEPMPPDSSTTSPQSLTAEAQNDLTKWLETQQTLAASTNLALVTVDDDNDFFGGVANETSICQSFRDQPEKALRCAEFCGRARERALEAGGVITYRCHANLHCFAAQVNPVDSPSPLIVIGGGAFFSSREFS